MTPTQTKQAQQYKRFDLAAVSFRECKALTEHLIQLGIVPKSSYATLYSACCAGIVVTYARPFLASDGLGPLPSQFGNGFPSAEMAELHEDVLTIRNRVFAHRDLVKTQGMRLHPESEPVLFESHIIISPSASGKKAAIHSQPALLYLLPDRLPGIVKLCDFQIERASKEAVEILRNLAGTKSYRPGRYTVGKDFP